MLIGAWTADLGPALRTIDIPYSGGTCIFPDCGDRQQRTNACVFPVDGRRGRVQLRSSHRLIGQCRQLVCGALPPQTRSPPFLHDAPTGSSPPPHCGRSRSRRPSFPLPSSAPTFGSPGSPLTLVRAQPYLAFLWIHDALGLLMALGIARTWTFALGRAAVLRLAGAPPARGRRASLDCRRPDRRGWRLAVRPTPPIGGL